MFLELLFAQSGGIFEATRFAAPCGVSRSTITNYLAVLEATLVMHIIRPYASRKATEIVAAPKVYGFDTGFVCTYRGWDSLRPQDLGLLWEHFVLNEIYAHLGQRTVQYWRTKQGQKIDFVFVRRGRDPIAIECKWSARDFNPANLQAFRRFYPKGTNLVVVAELGSAFERHWGDLTVRFITVEELPLLLA